MRLLPAATLKVSLVSQSASGGSIPLAKAQDRAPQAEEAEVSDQLDIYDALGQKAAAALIETLQALESLPPAIRYPGITALEEFYLRFTGHDLDWETLSEKLKERR